MQNSPNALLLIDDAKIRRQAASAAERLLRRYDRLSQAAESFYNLDQRLFEDWYRLTFRDELAKQNSLIREVAKLRRERTAIEAYAEFANVTLDEAYAFLDEEKLRYELGTPEEKAKIEEARLYRQRRSPQGKKEARAEAREKRKAKADAAAMKNWWAWFAGLDDAAIAKVSEEPAFAMEVLLIGLLTWENESQKAAGLRFWDQTSLNTRKLASARYSDLRGADLSDYVCFLRGEEPAAKAPAPEPAASSPPPAEENLKLLYRKLVRFLHPDARGPKASLDSWHKKAWHDGQEAYQSGNYKALASLYRIVMLRLGRLGELTMAEIRVIAAGVEQDFKQLQRETKSMRSAPYWKFSKRKDYFELTRRFRTGLEGELAHLEDQASHLREEFRTWAMISAGRRSSARRLEKKGRRTGRR